MAKPSNGDEFSDAFANVVDIFDGGRGKVNFRFITLYFVNQKI